jgi:hypothetical protein
LQSIVEHVEGGRRQASAPRSSCRSVSQSVRLASWRLATTATRHLPSRPAAPQKRLIGSITTTDRSRGHPPVAVLVGPATASSGEALAIAFRGRPSTRLFGATTRGLTTSNRVFPLSDGSLLNLSTAAFADRTGTSYPNGVTPDELWNGPPAVGTGGLPLNWLPRSRVARAAARRVGSQSNARAKAHGAEDRQGTGGRLTRTLRDVAVTMQPTQSSTFSVRKRAETRSNRASRPG